MLEKLIGKTKYKEAGISLVELLLAVGLATTVITVTAVGVQSGQYLALDAELSSVANTKAQTMLEEARAKVRTDYLSVNEPVVAYETYGGITFTKTIMADPASFTECGKDLVSTVSWKGSNDRDLKVELKTHVTDIQTAFFLSHCSGLPPLGGWNPPVTYNCANFNPGKPTGLDVLNGVVYMSGDKAPFLYINDTNGSVLNTGCQAKDSPPFITFANSYNAGQKINDIKVAKLANGNTYVFAARDTTPGELQIINVTDKINPSLVKNVSLQNVSGSNSQAFRVAYFEDKVYVIVREGAVNEFHIINVTTPATAFEIGSGVQLNTTVESLQIAKIKGKTVAFFAADSNSREILVYDVTDPLNVTEITAARQDLPGNQDGASILYVNGYLYFGRESTGNSEPEFYIYDASDPWSGLTLKQSKDIDTGVIGLAVAGPYAFLATKKANAEFQVWTSSPFSPIQRVNTVPFNFPNQIYNGVVYEEPYVYVASQANDSLRYLYSP